VSPLWPPRSADLRALLSCSAPRTGLGAAADGYVTLSEIVTLTCNEVWVSLGLARVGFRGALGRPI